MFTSLTNLFRHGVTKARAKYPLAPQTGKTARPTVENLEDRQLLACNLFFSGFNTLNIICTPLADTVRVAEDGHDEYTRVEHSTEGDPSPTVSWFRTADIRRIHFVGDRGGDDFRIDRGHFPCTAFGGQGNDTLWGGSNTDVLYGEEDNDELHGGFGDDVLYGDSYEPDTGVYGNGHDVMYGDAGNDTMYGADGYNQMYGGADRDTLVGGNFWDDLYGGGGNDVLRGLGDVDYLYGEAGTDALYGGFGDDFLDGGEGARDFLDGEAGADTPVQYWNFDFLFWLEEDVLRSDADDTVWDVYR